MGTRAEELSTTPADIEATRRNLSRDIDELSDKVSPQRVVARRKEAVRSRFGGLRDKIMGNAADARRSAGFGMSSAGSSIGDSASGTAASVQETARGAVDAVEQRAEGNPLAAGLVAFGAGMVIAALLPPSEKEMRVAGTVVDTAKEHGQPVVEQAKSVGQDIAQDLKESAYDAAQHVQQTAQASVGNVRDEGEASAQRVKDEATPS